MVFGFYPEMRLPFEKFTHSWFGVCREIHRYGEFSFCEVIIIRGTNILSGTYLRRCVYLQRYYCRSRGRCSNITFQWIITTVFNLMTFCLIILIVRSRNILFLQALWSLNSSRFCFLLLFYIFLLYS